MDASDNAQLRALSEVAFGQRYRLECMLRISQTPDAEVSLTELASELDLLPSQIQNAFGALVEVGLLRRIDTKDRRRKSYRCVRDSPAWAWAHDLAASTGFVGVPDNARAANLGGASHAQAHR